MFTWIAKPLMAAVGAVGGYCNFQSTRHAVCESKQGKATPPAYAYDPAEVRIKLSNGRDVTKDTEKNTQQPARKKRISYELQPRESWGFVQYSIDCNSYESNGELWAHIGILLTPQQWEEQTKSGSLIVDENTANIMGKAPFVQCTAEYIGQARKREERVQKIKDQEAMLLQLELSDSNKSE